MSDPAAALDARILAAIAAYALDDDAFLALAVDLFAYQIANNRPYAAFARSLGFDADRLPQSLEEIPAAPAAAFKEQRLATFPPQQCVLWFQTSGTTQGTGGRHEFDSPALYEAALLASFDRMMLADGQRLRYLLLVPDPRHHPHSSLGFMMDVVAEWRGDGEHGWYVSDDALALEPFLDDVQRACSEDRPVCLATTAFALVALLDALASASSTLSLPRGSRIMETGGFKGRSRIVQRDDLYREAAHRLGVPISMIVAEYGMTELSSQYYDALESRSVTEPRVKRAPPWLRSLVVDDQGRPVPDGIVGSIRHIDLANRGSVIAVDTEDLGAAVAGGLVLLGREPGAELRGCSLDAETLLRRRG